MTAVRLSKPDFAELLEIQAERRRLDDTDIRERTGIYQDAGIGRCLENSGQCADGIMVNDGKPAGRRFICRGYYPADILRQRTRYCVGG